MAELSAETSRLDLRIGASLPGPLRRAGLPRPEPVASGTGRGGARAAALIQYGQIRQRIAGASLQVRRRPELAQISARLRSSIVP